MPKSWGFWAYLLLAVVVVDVARKAFAVPWTWTDEQSLTAIGAVLWTGFGLSWGVTWLRGGKQAVVARWSRRQENIEKYSKAYEGILTIRNFILAVLAGFGVIFLLVVIQTIYGSK